MQNFPGSYALPYTAKAEATPALAIAMLGAFVSFLLIPPMLKQPSAAVLLLLIWLLIGFLALWLNGHRVVLLLDRVRYVTLTRRRELRYNDIVRLEGWLARGRSRSGGYAVPMLGIYARAADQPTILISSKPFSKRDIAVVVDAVAAANPAVELNRLAQMLRRGDVD